MLYIPILILTIKVYLIILSALLVVAYVTVAEKNKLSISIAVNKLNLVGKFRYNLSLELKSFILISTFIKVTLYLTFRLIFIFTHIILVPCIFHSFDVFLFRFPFIVLTQTGLVFIGLRLVIIVFIPLTTVVLNLVPRILHSFDVFPINISLFQIS